MTPKTLYLVLPCYNEAAVILETAKRLQAILCSLTSQQLISNKSKVLFVNDGSTDSTWEIIEGLHHTDKMFSGLNLTRNQGHQQALLAGLMVAKDHCDFVISLDADLQDDIEIIPEMIAKYHNGHDIVYGVRGDRKADTGFKRITATLFYQCFKGLGGEIIPHHADFRLMSKRALDSLSEFQEVNLFLRGLVPLLGYDHDIVYYTRGE